MSQDNPYIALIDQVSPAAAKDTQPAKVEKISSPKNANTASNPYEGNDTLTRLFYDNEAIDRELLTDPTNKERQAILLAEKQKIEKSMSEAMGSSSDSGYRSLVDAVQEDQDNPTDYARPMSQLGGAAVGYKGAKGLNQTFESSRANVNAPQSRSGMQRYLNSQVSDNIRLPLKDLEKLANEGKQIRTMSEVQNALARIQEVPEQRITKPVYKPESYGSKVMIDTGKVLPSTIPGVAGKDLSAFTHNPTMFTKAADAASDVANAVRSGLPTLGKIGVGTFGGALAGSQLYDAYSQYKKEGEGLHMPSAKNAAQFASGLGGAIGTIPLGLTQAVGLGLQSPELYYQAKEAVRQMQERIKRATPEEKALAEQSFSNVDPMGNPMGGNP